MTENIVTAKEPLAFAEAIDILKREKVGKLLILDAQDRLVSMVTRSDLKKVRDYPEMSRDLSGKLLVGAAVPAKEGQPDEARANALAEAGANLLYLFGDGVDAQLELIQRLKVKYLSYVSFFFFRTWTFFPLRSRTFPKIMDSSDFTFLFIPVLPQRPTSHLSSSHLSSSP